jgi:hypothetical protein
MRVGSVVAASMTMRTGSERRLRVATRGIARTLSSGWRQRPVSVTAAEIVLVVIVVIVVLLLR